MSAEAVLRAEEDKEQWGLLDKSFSGHAQQKGPDHHLEAGAWRVEAPEASAFGSRHPLAMTFEDWQ